MFEKLFYHSLWFNFAQFKCFAVQNKTEICLCMSEQHYTYIIVGAHHITDVVVENGFGSTNTG